MIKAVFLDLDGTLLSHSRPGIPESACRALEALRNKGILVFLATGRHICDITHLVGDKVKLDGYVTMNGQMCLDANREILSHHPITGADMVTMAGWFESRRVPVIFMEKQGMYINFVNDTVRAAQTAVSSPVPQVGVYRGGDVYQVDVYADEQMLQTLAGELKTCHMSRWNAAGADIVDAQQGKVAGLQVFLGRYGLTREEILALGDGENDAAMLRFAGIGVAMGNATPQVKAQADYVTSHIDEDGLANALKHFDLI